MNIGVALTLNVRAARQGPATSAGQAPGPHSHSCLDDGVREAARWLQAAFDGGHAFAKLHLAHLNFDAGQEDAALAHLTEHLSWQVQRGRDTCAVCGQTRGEETPMLTCSGCRVARFCSADHQIMASKKPHWAGDCLSRETRTHVARTHVTVASHAPLLRTTFIHKINKNQSIKTKTTSKRAHAPLSRSRHNVKGLSAGSCMHCSSSTTTSSSCMQIPQIAQQPLKPPHPLLGIKESAPAVSSCSMFLPARLAGGRPCSRSTCL